MACPLCNDTGLIKKFEDGYENVYRCSCPIGIAKDKQLIVQKLQMANIYKEYWDKEIKDLQMQPQQSHSKYIHRIRETAENIKKYKENGLTLIIYGDSGVGKSMGVSLVLKHAIKNYNFDCFYITMTDLLSGILNDLNTADEVSFQEKVKEADILAIDDIGLTAMHKEFPIVTIETIVKARISNNKVTFLILKDGTMLHSTYRFLQKLIPESNIYNVTGVNGWLC